MAINRWPRIFPMSGENQGGGKDTLWLQLTVKELLAQTMDVRTDGGLTVGNTVETMQFLLPMSYIENIDHNWEDLDTIASKISEKYRSLVQAGREVTGITGSRGKYGNFLRTESDTAIRPDSPTVFKSSQKRSLPLTFHLADQGDTERDVFEPVNLLMYYSSSGMGNEGESYFKIDYPYVFELKTVTGDNQEISLINYQHAALTNIQPTFEGPYRNGYPTKCELTLTFQDLQPLFKKTFDRNSSRVSVSIAGTGGR